MRRTKTFAHLLALFLVTGTIFGQSAPSAVDDLKSPDATTRAKAARQLGQSGDLSAVEPLAAAVYDPSPQVRKEVAIALSTFHSQQALDALIISTRDGDPDIRILAIHGLVGYYTGKTPSYGFVAFWKRTWRNAKDRFVEESVRIDPGVSVDPKVITALAATMNDTTLIASAREAADALGILVARAAIPDLIKAANSIDEDLAVEALNSLAKIKDTSAGPQLVNLLDSPNKEVRRQAAVTVGILRTSEALPKLQSMYENGPDAKTRQKALEGLVYLGSPISAPIFLKALWSADKEKRQLSAEGLARTGDAAALSELLRAVQSEKDGDAKLALEFAITALGRDDYLSTLVGSLSSTRGYTAQNYLQELAHNPSLLSKLLPYMDNKDAAVRRRLCTVMMYSGDATSIAPLERLSNDPNPDVAGESLRALRAVRARSSGPAATPTAGPNP
jgi:HEAT repeat protein